MPKEGQLTILFLINPVSGGKAKTDWEESIRSHFRQSPHRMEFFLLTGDSDEASIARHVETVKPDRVVSVGGDGTVKLAAEYLANRGIPLGILPAGSANGMARELGIPLTAAEALDVTTGDSMRPIDLIRINNGELCIHLSDLGLNALLVKHFEGSKKRGMWGYARSVFRVLWQKQKLYATIRTDEDEVKRKAYMIVFANARKYGTGANINPDGDPGDGRFEIVILRRLNLWEILKALLTNRSFDPEKIEVLSTTKVRIDTLRRAYFQVDGEYRGKFNHVEAEIVPAALQVLVPANVK